MPRLSSEQLATGLVLTAVFVLASMAPAQSDTWWLIRTGQDIWQSGQIPVVDTYSHTIRGRPWPNHEWLTDVLFYSTYAVAGLPGLTLVCATLIVVAWGLSWRLMTGSFEVRLSVFVASLVAAAGSWALRPQLTTMVCLVVTAWLLRDRRIWWLPPLFLIWANFHAGVILGVVAIGVVGLVETIRLRRVPIDLLAAGMLSAAATLATPLGFELWHLLLSYGDGSRGEGIQEWMAPALPPENLPFWAVVAALVIGTAYRRRSFDVRTTRLVTIAFALLPLALDAIRNIAIFLLIAAPAATAALAAAKTSLPAPRDGDRSTTNAAVSAFAMTAASILVAGMWWLPLDRLNWRPISRETIAAVTQCSGPLYNTYDDGGALIWFVPTQPVFIDSRYDPYPVAFFHENRHVEETGEYHNLFTRYGIQCALLRTSTPSEQALRNDPGWRVEHSDEKHTVLVRNHNP